jgi:glycosyltransferase involved in cell wall biosynthesis
MKTKIAYIVATPITAKAFLGDQLSYMRERGLDVTLISSPGEELLEVASKSQIDALPLNISREIDLRQDIVSLWNLYREITALKPNIVNATTPKAAFLGMIAAWLARVPIRIYVLRGLRSETAVGFKKRILDLTERIASLCATDVVPVSLSLRDTYIRKKLTVAEKTSFVCSDAIHVERFLPTDASLEKTEQIRQKFNLSLETPTIGFVGRFTKDKGISELIAALHIVRASLPATHLLLVGDFESGDPLPSETVSAIQSDPQIIQAGFVNDTAPYYSLMQLLVLPSYREGLPNSPLEASLAGIPSVGFMSTGVVDSICDGKTGILVRAGDAKALATAILDLLQDIGKRKHMGKLAQERTLQDFNPQKIHQSLYEFYNQKIQSFDCNN